MPEFFPGRMRYRPVWFQRPSVRGPFMSMTGELRRGDGIVEVRQGDTRQAPTDLAFDVSQRSLLFRRHQDPGVAFGPGAGSAPAVVCRPSPMASGLRRSWRASWGMTAGMVAENISV